jgi:hypothetical protein
MNADPSPRRRLVGRLIGCLVLVFTSLTTYFIGVWMGAFYEPNGRPSAPAKTLKKPGATAAAAPGVDATRPADPRQPEPRAVEARARAIRRDADAIVAECQRAAGGDWKRWRSETASYRAALKARLDATDPARSWLLEGRDDFPLFELKAPEHLIYFNDERSLEQFRKESGVVAAHRWFRQRGIDLIFVPVPKMTEVYIEHFLDPCPADGVVAPHLRQALLDLLNEDVEVVDAFSLLRAQRDTDTEYLYNTCDPHWAPRGMRIVAREVADRIARYKFGARARYGMPIVNVSPGPYCAPGYLEPGLAFGSVVLDKQQQRRATAVQTLTQPSVTLPGGEAPPDDAQSPVFLFGNSYALDFREQFVRELNLLVRSHIWPGASTEFFASFLREPELLDHCRVAVWLTTEEYMRNIVSMPQPVMAALKDGETRIPPATPEVKPPADN